MKNFYLLFIGIFIFSQTQAASVFGDDSVPDEENVAIGYATSDFFKGTPEGNLGDLVTDAMLRVAVPNGENSDKISLLAAQSIRGNLKKGEIFLKTIQEILPNNDSLLLYRISEKDIHILLDRVAQKGGMPGAGFSMAMENMKAQNILINGEPINSGKKYLLITTKNTMKVLNLQAETAEMPINIGIRQALINYIKETTEKGKPIFGYRQRRIYYKN